MTSLPALLLIAINLSCPTPLAAADETKPAAETNDAARMVPKIKRTSQPHKPPPPKLTEELRTIDDFSKPWWRWENATGDWDGARPWLLDHGIIAQIVYTFEVFSNVRGGVTTRNATKALGNLDVTLTVDTERMDLWKGGTLFLHFENLAGDGNGINTEVGFPLNQISNLNAANFVQLSGYYYSQELFDGALSLKMGKSNVNVDFISSYISGEFINDGVSPAQNIPMPSFPDTALGFAAFWIPLDWFSVGSGVYGGDPNGESFGDAGLFAGETFSIVEFKLLDLFKDYPGLYEGGAWLLTTDLPEIIGDPGTRVFDENYGAYLLLDQQVYTEHRSKNDRQGLRAYFQLSWAPSDRNLIEWRVGGGLLYTGLIPRCDRDELGFGVINANVTDDLRSQGLTDETNIEWFYKIQLTPWMSLQPDIQYVINPGGDGRNAVALGVRSVMFF